MTDIVIVDKRGCPVFSCPSNVSQFDPGEDNPVLRELMDAAQSRGWKAFFVEHLPMGTLAVLLADHDDDNYAKCFGVGCDRGPDDDDDEAVVQDEHGNFWKMCSDNTHPFHYLCVKPDGHDGKHRAEFAGDTTVVEW